MWHQPPAVREWRVLRLSGRGGTTERWTGKIFSVVGHGSAKAIEEDVMESESDTSRRPSERSFPLTSQRNWTPFTAEFDAVHSVCVLTARSSHLIDAHLNTPICTTNPLPSFIPSVNISSGTRHTLNALEKASSHC